MREAKSIVFLFLTTVKESKVYIEKEIFLQESGLVGQTNPDHGLYM